MNTKMGGDLFQINFESLKNISPRTMLVGIDVCHAPGLAQSVVGFCASINPALSKYYSEKFVQKKKQEIIDKKLKDAVKRAILYYKDKNKDMPDHIIVYRDGVSD